MSLAATESRPTEATSSDRLALAVLSQLAEAGICYCVLRGGDQLYERSDNVEIDLLVEQRQWQPLVEQLERLGFVALRTPGHAPHHFFVSYDGNTGRWLKLDVVTTIAFCRPVHALVTDLAGGCLSRRRKLQEIFVPSAADELMTLLLHCLLDKGSFTEGWQTRLQALCDDAETEPALKSLVAQYWVPTASSDDLLRAIRDGDWNGLLKQRGAVQRRLSSGQLAAMAGRKMRDRSLRKLNRFVRFFAPDALSVAILAPDGAGKSTLAEGLQDSFLFPVKQIYMGLYQQRQAASRSRLPGLGLLGKLCTQWGRYLRARRYLASGTFVVFDRYTYDAYLPSRKPLNRWQRMRRWILGHACPPPDLIVVLDAPGERLFARKGEHSPEYLEGHRQAYLALRGRWQQVAVVDALLPAEEVRRRVTEQIWRLFAARRGGTK